MNNGRWTLPSLGGATLLLVLSVPVTASAEPTAADRATARELALSALADEDAGRYAQALDKMQRAEAILPAPPHLLAIARCEVALGRLVEGAETYQELSRFELGNAPPPVWSKAVQDGERELDRLTPKVPKLRVLVEPAGIGDAELRIDDQPVPAAVIGVDRPTDPGRHRVRVTAPGRGAAEKTVNLARGESKTVTLVLAGESRASTDEDAHMTPSSSGGASKSQPRRHDGFLFRLGVGGGRLEDQFEVNVLGIPGLNVARGVATGASGSFELAFGTQIGRPGLTLGGAVYGEQVASPKVSITGAPGTDVSVGTLALVGPFIDFYPDAGGGLHFEASLDLARIEMKDSTGTVEKAQPFGGGGVLGIGYELWLADEWSLGILGRFIGASLWAGDVHHTVTVPSLLIEATYD